MVTSPLSVVTPSSALRTNASTSLLISFSAIERPMETATPVLPPTAAASEAAPATALMPESSSAFSATLEPLMPSAPSPSMYALTSVVILFSA